MKHRTHFSRLLPLLAMCLLLAACKTESAVPDAPEPPREESQSASSQSEPEEPSVEPPSKTEPVPEPESESEPESEPAPAPPAVQSTEIQLHPFEYDDIAAHPMRTAAVGDSFYIAPADDLPEETRFAVERYDADGRLTRTAALPEQTAILRLERAGERLLALGYDTVTLLDADLNVVQTVAVPEEIRASLDGGAQGYDVARDLTAFLYEEPGGEYGESGWRSNGREPGSSLYIVETGAAVSLGGPGAVRRFCGDTGKLLGVGSKGSVLFDRDGANPRALGVDLTPSLDAALPLGRWLPVWNGGECGVFDFVTEEFSPLPGGVWEEEHGAGVGGGTLYSLRGGELMRTTLSTMESAATGDRLDAADVGILCVSDSGVLLYTSKSGLYLHKGLPVPAAEVDPNLPLPRTLGSGETELADGTRVRVALRLVSGYYLDAESPGYAPGGGIYETNYTGSYDVVVTDAPGNVLYRQPLLFYGREEMNFSGEFPLLFEDYNGDGSPDFTLGQWGSGNGNDYALYTVRKSGRVEPLDGGEFVHRSFEFSVRLEQPEPGSFLCTQYDQELGRDVRYRYTWNDDAFYSAREGEEIK